MFDRHGTAGDRRQRIKELLKKIVRIALLIALFYTVRATIGEELFDGFWAVMFEPYVEFASQYIGSNWGAIITHPITLILIAIAMFNFIFR